METATTEISLSFNELEYLVDGLAVLRRHLGERGYHTADYTKITDLRARLRMAMVEVAPETHG